MNKYKNILIDFNGTIVDDVDLCLTILNEMLIMKNHPPISKERYLEVFTFPIMEYYQKAGFKLPEDDFDNLATYYMDNYARRFNTCSLCEGVKETLETLKGQGYHLYIVSASDEEMLLKQLASYHLNDYFEGISALKGYYAHSKVESTRLFIEENHLKNDESLLIGDTLHDAEVAKMINIDCVLVSSGHQSYTRLKANYPNVIHSLNELNLVKLMNS